MIIQQPQFGKEKEINFKIIHGMVDEKVKKKEQVDFGKLVIFSSFETKYF